MRSTRAAAAIARLNRRLGGQRFTLVVTGSGQFQLQELSADGDRVLSAPLELDAFVQYVDALGPQPAPRRTKSDAAFARQLVKKSPS